MQILDILSRLGVSDPEVPFDLSMGRASLYCLNADFMIIYDELENEEDCDPVLLKFVQFGYKVERSTMLKIFMYKFLQN